MTAQKQQIGAALGLKNAAISLGQSNSLAEFAPFSANAA
jgi:hypothetical protein